MSQLLKKAARAGVYILLLTPLVTIKTTYFPFVFSKALFFQVGVEILLALYLVFLFLEPEQRPGFTFLSLILLSYFLILTVTTVTAVCPKRAFWSTQERMTGLFNLLHLGGFFILLKGLFKTKREWKNLFRFFVIVSLAVSFLSLSSVKTKNPGPLGNPGFLATYLLFAFFFSLQFLFDDKSFFWKVVYLAQMTLALFLVYKLERRAAIAALAGGLFVFLLLKTFNLKGKRRWFFLLFLGGLLVFAFLVWRGVVLGDLKKSFLRGSGAREISWGISWRSFKAKPLLGWGPENYLYAFSRHFDPEYTQYTDRWFDKAHNQFFEALVTSGLPGFALYLALFGATAWNLLRKKKFGLLALVASYSFNNLFWFDVTSTLAPFFMVLAFSDLGREEVERISFLKKNKWFLLLPLPLLLFGFYFGNLKPFLASRGLVKGNFSRAVSLDTFVSYEARKWLAKKAGSSKNARIVVLAEREIGKALEKRPNDPKLYIHLAHLSYRLGKVGQAEKAARRALEVGPQRPDLQRLLEQIEKESSDKKGSFNRGRQAPEKSPALKPGIREVPVSSFPPV